VSSKVVTAQTTAFITPGRWSRPWWM